MTEPTAPSALGKGLLVLESLTRHHRLSEIAADTGLPLSTVHRVLRELHKHGWVYQNVERNYTAGGRLLTLARTLLENGDYHTLADPILRRLVDDTGHTMHFGVVEGTWATYVSKIDGHRAYRMRSRVGLRIPLHSTAIGKAYLAALAPSEREAVVGSLSLERITEHTIVDPDALLEHLAAHADLGWSIDDRENESTTRCVGAAVFDGSGRPIGGVSLSSLKHDLSPRDAEELAPRVQDVAAELSATLGERGSS